jgi:HAD superfamily hydrolase (TIGR01509 family)
MVDAALLELEGVVFDTRELRRTSLSDALLEHGLTPELDPDAVDGADPRTAARATFAAQLIDHDDVLLDLIALSAERRFSAGLAARGAALRDGARDFVREAAATTRLAAVTRTKRSDVDTMLRLSSLAEFFTITIASEDVLDGKPSADGHRVALDRLNRQRTVTAKGAIALEDGPAGIRAARAAGLRCVAIGPMAAHLAIEADAYVPTLARQTIRSLDLLSRPGQERVQ